MKIHLHRWGSWAPCVRVETVEGLNTSRVEENLWIRKCDFCPKRSYKPRVGIRWIVQEKFEEVP